MHFIDNIYPLYQIYSKQKNTNRRETGLKNYIGGLDLDLVLEGNPLELMEQNSWNPGTEIKELINSI